MKKHKVNLPWRYVSDQSEVIDAESNLIVAFGRQLQNGHWRTTKAEHLDAEFMVAAVNATGGTQG